METHSLFQLNKLCKLICLFIGLFAMSNQVQAQKSFSRDSAKFIKEYSTYVLQLNSEEAKSEVKQFQELWETGVFSKSQQEAINQMANSMLLNEMKPEPYFIWLTKCINAWALQGLDKKVLQDFIKISSENLETNKLGFLSFMKTCYPLFKDNILADNSQRQWFVRDNKYTLSSKGGVSIEFVKSDLICKAVVDSMIIFNTTGVFYPNKQIWKGDKGKMTWQRHGNTDAFVEFGEYQVDLNGSNIKIENVDYTNTEFFTVKVKGVFEDKVSYTTDSALVSNSNYPSFSTYDAKVEIKNLVGDQARYFGGISVKGKEIFSQTVGDKPATIELLSAGKPRIIAKSTSFKISGRSAISQGAEIYILMDSGSVHHPKAIFNYNFEKKLVIISRGKEGLTRSNFEDNYHNIELEVDNVIWQQKDSFIYFDNPSSDKPAIIESLNYYKRFKYDKIQGMLSANPIEVMVRYVISNRSNDFYLPDYAKYRRNERDNMLQQVFDLADGGFLRYNRTTDSIHVEPKMFNYYYASKGVKDYDVIRLSSVIAARSNAYLNLLNDEIVVEGVRRFNFSDSQNVTAVPTEQTLTINGNRSIQFGGMIRAGRFDLFSKDFIFDYETFATLPTTIDSLRIYYPDENNQMRRVNSVLSNLFGVLEIDKPNNKSGLKDYPEYPIFRSTRGSEITYEMPSNHNSAYKANGASDADDFKFIVDPFEIDSMDNFTVEGLQFDGTFVSAGIFPEFRYKASIQEDFSLGFKTTTPPGGYAMYKGKGQGKMAMSLSNQGFYGSGTIDYSGTSIESESFLLLPNQTVATANKFTVPESGKYPAVVGANLGTTWNPYEDKMSLATTGADATMKVFKMGYDFKGVMKVTPSALKADGILSWSEAEFTSKNMVYQKNGVTADSGAIKIYAADPNKIAFNSGNLKSNIDFDKREGKFTTNNPNDLTILPFNQYGSNLNDYKWNMNDKTIDINIGKAGSKAAYFVSTRPDQDSLKFEAKHALFNIATGVLAIDQIPYIDVADSRVFPFEGKAFVRENAEMDTLFNSKIDANRIDKFHQFYACKTKVQGRNQLRATGSFNYENRHGKQEVFFDSIYAQNKVLFADAYVEDKDDFVIDRRIGYKGVMRVRGNSQANHLFGYVKPLHGFDSFGSKWVRYRDSIDRNNVVLRLGIPQDEDGRTLPIGVYGYGNGAGYYPMFYGWKERYSDNEITADTGLLYYDYTKKELVIGSEAKLFRNSLQGNTMRIDPEKSFLTAEGRMELGFDYKQTNIKFAGEATYLEGDSTFTFNLLNLIEMPYPMELVDQITKMATEAGGTPVSITDLFVKKAFAATLSPNENVSKAIKKLEEDKKFKGTEQDSSGLNSGILKEVKDLSDKLLKKMPMRLIAFRVDGLRYVPRERALFSNSKIDLFQVGDNMINKSFDCMYEIEKKRSGDVFTLYIEFTKNDWVFLNYVRGVLYILTSDDQFNRNMPNWLDRASNDDFSVRMATSRTVTRFQDRYYDQ